MFLGLSNLKMLSTWSLSGLSACEVPLFPQLSSFRVTHPCLGGPETWSSEQAKYVEMVGDPDTGAEYLRSATWSQEAVGKDGQNWATGHVMCPLFQKS